MYSFQMETFDEFSACHTLGSDTVLSGFMFTAYFSPFLMEKATDLISSIFFLLSVLAFSA